MSIKNKILLIISVVLIMLWYWQSESDVKPRVVFCNVGQGDAILISKGNFQMLIDTGPDNKKVFSCLGKYMPFMDKTIEMVILTHFDSDHVGSLEGLYKNYKIDNLLASYKPAGEFEQYNYSKYLSENDVLTSDWFYFEVLSPEKVESGEVDANELSLVAKLIIEDKSFLLMGDASKEVEQRLIWRKRLDDKINVLKVGHHGSRTSTSVDLLNNIMPDVAVVSVGKNSFGHPDKGVMYEMQKRGIEIYRTDKDGNVVMKW
jgi:competence protein ComEC